MPITLRCKAILHNTLFIALLTGTLAESVVGQLQPQVLHVNFIDQYSGLSDTRNFFCYQDSRGLLWISSFSGLHCFDGQRITRYSSDNETKWNISGDHVNGYFSEDSHGNIWIATLDGINQYERKQNRFNTYKRSGDYPRDYFSIGLDSLQQLWILNNDELLRFNIVLHRFEFVQRVMPGVDRAELYLDSTGRASYIFCYANEFGESLGLQVISLKNSKSNSSNVYFNQWRDARSRVKDVFAINDSMALVTTHTSLFLFNYITGNYNIIPHPVLKSEYDKVFYRAVEGINDSIALIGTYAHDLFTFDFKNLRFKGNYQMLSNGIPVVNPPQAIFRDRKGGVWITVGHQGLAFFHPENQLFKSIHYQLTTSRSGSRIGLSSLTGKSDGQVIGTSLKHGVVVFDSNASIRSHKHLSNSPGISDNAVLQACTFPKGETYFITENKVCKMDSTGYIESIDLRERVIFQCIENYEGSLILGAQKGGLYQLLKTLEITSNGVFLERDELRLFENSGENKKFNFIEIRGDLLFAGTDQSFLEIYKLEKCYGVACLTMLWSHSINTGINDVIRGTSRDEYFVATDNGLYRYEHSGKTLSKITWPQCLSGALLLGMEWDDLDRLWISSNNGIFRLEFSDLFCQHFDLEHGLTGKDFVRNCHVKLPDGKIWFGNNNGITIIDPHKQDLKLPATNIRISNILVDDAVYPTLNCQETGTWHIPDIRSISIPFRKNTMGFEFASINYSVPASLDAEYRLSDIESNWVSSQSPGYTRYANLPPGDYTFEVRLKDLPDRIRTLKVHIIPPFYYRSWFLLTSFIFLLLMVWSTVQAWEKRKRKLLELRHQSALAIERERSRISNDMHDDLGSLVSALNLKTRFIADQTKEPSIREQLNELAENTKKISQQIRDTIWVLNSHNDTTDILISRLHQYALDYFSNSSITCHIDIPEASSDHMVPGSHRRELFFAFKEALQNICKHSGASEVRINISVNEKLTIKIRDNGSGFDTTRPNMNGNGLTSMENRMKRIKAEFFIHSEPGETALQFIYPLARTE